MFKISINAVLALALSTIIAGAADISSLLNAYPAKDQKSLDAANAAFVAAAPQSIKDACALLLPYQPTKDIKVRYALNGTARYVSRPGAENERIIVSKALCEMLPTLKDIPIKRFVISLLQRCGGEEAVPTLTQNLNNKDLCGPAVRALAAIDSVSALESIKKALAQSSGEIQQKLIHALGDEAFTPAANTIMQTAQKTDSPTIRDTSLDALANMGFVPAAEMITHATKNTKGFAFIHAIARCQRLGQQIAARKENKKAAIIFRYILKTDCSDAHLTSGIQGAAADGLVKAIGAQATDDLIALTKNADYALLTKIADLAENLPTYEKIYSALAQRDIIFHYRLLAIKGQRGDQNATTALLSSLKTDRDNRYIIYPLTRALDKQAVTSTLLEICGENKDTQEIMTWTLEMPGSVLYPAIKRIWDTASPSQLAAFIEIIGIRQADDFEDNLIAALDNPDGSVRVAAISALGNMDSTKAIAKFSDVYKTSDSATDRKKALRSIATFCRNSNNIAPLTALLTTPQAHTEILPLLASIGGGKALATVTKLLNSSDAQIKEAATRALIKWKDPTAIPSLIKLAQTTPDLKYNALALAAVARLSSMKKTSGTLSQLTRAYKVAKRPEEKTALQSAMFNLMMDKNFKKKEYGRNKQTIIDAAALLDNARREKLTKKFGEEL